MTGDNQTILIQGKGHHTNTNLIAIYISEMDHM